MLLYSWLSNAVKQKGGAKALIYRDTYLSWRGLLHRVDRRASEFESTGVRPGDLVGLMLGNVPDFVILSLALSKLKAVPVPLDPTTSTRELEMLMSTVPLRGLITRPRGGDAPLPVFQGAAEGKSGTPQSRKRLQGTLLTCSIYDTEPRPLARKKAEQIAAVLITVNAAGDPKPVERTVANLTAEGEGLVGALGINADDRFLLTVPLFQAFGFDFGIVGALAGGSPIYLEDELAPNRIIKLVREQKITVLPGTHSLFAQLARLPSTRPLSGKAPIRMISLGGGLTGQNGTNFTEKYGINPLSCHHSAETGTISIDDHGQHPATAGKPLPSIEIRVTSEKTGKPLGTGKRGVLWLKSPALSPSKLAPAPAATSGETVVGAFDSDGWYRTGDIVTIDRSGRLTLHGREDDVVPIDGKRVALGEVEGCLETYPKVSEAQAEVITDPLGGPMVVARVVLKQRAKADPEKIIDHCAKKLAPYKVPRRIEICESL